MSAYGAGSYGSSTYGAGSVGAYGTLAVTAPAASATASMTAPAVMLGVRVVAPSAAATASMTAPRVRLTPLFGAYDLDANSSQALNVRVTMDATLVGDPLPSALPSHFTDPQIRARRLSLVMPAPSLDSRGRPT